MLDKVRSPYVILRLGHSVSGCLIEAIGAGSDRAQSERHFSNMRCVCLAL